MSHWPHLAHFRRAWRMRRIPICFMVVGFAVLALAEAGCSLSSETHTPGTGGTTGGTPTATATSPTGAATASATAASSGYPVLVYFSRHPDSDNNPADVFPVHRISPTLNVATYALGQLMAGPSASEASAGYYTPVTSALTGTSNCGGADFTVALNMRAGVVESGTATFQFCRATQLAGDLTGGRIRAEIEKTLLQFPTISKVVILARDGGCFDDFSGQNLCLR